MSKSHLNVTHLVFVYLSSMTTVILFLLFWFHLELIWLEKGELINRCK